MPDTNPHIKIVSALTLRKNLGALTDEVLYGNVWLKVTKNKTKALLLKPWDAEEAHETQGETREERAKRLMEWIDRIRERNTKKTKLVNGMSWSAFIQKDRHSH